MAIGDIPPISKGKVAACRPENLTMNTHVSHWKHEHLTPPAVLPVVFFLALAVWLGLRHYVG